VWGAVSSCFQCAQWMTMTPCANVSVGLPVLRDVLEQPLSAATDRLSQLLVLQGGEAISIVFHPFHFLSLVLLFCWWHSACHTQHVWAIVSLSSA
jgi:hypothetical protein